MSSHSLLPPTTASLAQDIRDDRERQMQERWVASTEAFWQTTAPTSGGRVPRNEPRQGDRRGRTTSR
ncbi:hypothetical protein [Plantibacter sp. YIM 135347]|uniref:hypothetical protein n=1 Tax=Plantibacter sp. YIM 135347 TaxID=3423919 RepID=UPI003D354F8A